MKLLVTGRNGQVVTALRERADAAGSGFTVETIARPHCDFSDPEGMMRALERYSGDVLVSAAAYTAVDRAESEPALARQVNAAAPRLLARFAAERAMPIVHLSTDYVFSGAGTTPFGEDDRPGPQTVYGATKLAGEVAVAEENPCHVILRTAWVFSPFGSNFVRTMLRLAAERDEISVVSDQWGSPTSALDLASGVIAIARRLTAEGGPKSYGVFHLAGTGSTNWSGLAEAVMAASAGAGGPAACIRPVASSDYPTAARRPANSRLASEKVQRDYGVSLPPWPDAVAAVVGRCLADRPIIAR